MRSLATAIVAASLVGTSSNAARAAPPDGTEFAVTPGLLTRPTGHSGSPVALGFGGRAGAMFSGFYFGVSVINYWGGSEPPPPPGVGAPGAPTSTGVVGAEYLLYGLELGYGFALFNRLILRPQLGGGVIQTTSTCSVEYQGVTVDCGGPTTHDAYFEPGVTALLPLGWILFAGVDANLLLFVGGSTVPSAFTTHAQLGLRY
jgi:hypothetical protein